MKAIVTLLGQILAGFVPAKLQPFAKAVLPFAVSLVLIGLAVLGSGKFDKVATEAAIVGVLGSVLTYLVPNARKHR